MLEYVYRGFVIRRLGWDATGVGRSYYVPSPKNSAVDYLHNDGVIRNSATQEHLADPFTGWYADYVAAKTAVDLYFKLQEGDPE